MEEATRRERERETERRQQELEAAEQAERAKPRTKAQGVTESLRVKLDERLELHGQLLLLLQRAQQKVRVISFGYHYWNL